jgi:acetylornithine deacetylase
MWRRTRKARGGCRAGGRSSRPAEIDARIGVPRDCQIVRDDLVQLTSALVAAASVNPSLVPGGAGEAEAAALVAEWARAAGLDVELVERTPGRPSAVVRARGSGGGRTLLLCGHLDTVGVEGMTEPNVPRLNGDRLYGRGAYDMKAGVAAALIACRELAREGLTGDVVVAAVADEEHASLGVQEVLEVVEADAAVVTEPTELELVVAHKGFVWVEIEVSGRGAHGSRPHLGVDAIVKMGPILTGLGELDAALGEHEHPRVGRGSVHASLIEGGAELSTYPGRCVLGLERRTLPGETGPDVEREITKLLDHCRDADPELVVSQRTLLVREPFEVDESSGVVQDVRAAAAEVLPAPPPIGGASYWADAAFIAAAGIPTVMFGPSGEGAHALEEWVSIRDTVAVTRTLVAAGIKLCA